METVGANGTFAGDIEKLGCACAITGNNRIKLILSEGVEVRDLFRVAAERNVQIRRLNYKRDSLEDIFLKAMESDAAPVSSGAKGVANGRL
jgi:ABC-2 type transport system ATP-binding protein